MFNFRREKGRGRGHEVMNQMIINVTEIISNIRHKDLYNHLSIIQLRLEQFTVHSIWFDFDSKCFRLGFFFSIQFNKTDQP